jgi:hypothetical protein
MRNVTQVTSAAVAGCYAPADGVVICSLKLNRLLTFCVMRTLRQNGF